MLKYNLFDSYQVIIFDLDNTLYDESVYLFSAYNDIGKFIEKQVGGYSGEYVSFLVTSFKKYGHHGLFDMLLSHFGFKTKIEMNDLLFLLRHTKVVLKVYDEMKMVLEYLLNRKCKVYILTNGNREQQQNKIESLDIQEILSKIEVIYANEYVPKPSACCIDKIVIENEVEKESVIMCGDSEVDYLAAKNAGIDFINVKCVNNYVS